MDLNGVKYYYIRNAQGDIIGLLDKTGVQVVSYTYDTWGKLISIKDKDGKDVTTDTTNVGYKNPYRYRGYRYDNETGLYYLNSRYYSPEWGRFINADGIVGQKGELLGHNLFAYCRNNPVNKYDSNGFIALDCEGRARTSPILVAEDNKRKASSSKSTSSSTLPSILRNTLCAGLSDKGISDEVDNIIPEYLALGVNRAVRRGTALPTAIIKTEGSALGARTVAKIGIVGVGLTGYAVWDNYHQGYSRQEATGRSAVDIGITGGVIVLSLMFPEAAIPIALVGSLGGEIIKWKIWGN